MKIKTIRKDRVGIEYHQVGANRLEDILLNLQKQVDILAYYLDFEDIDSLTTHKELELIKEYQEARNQVVEDD